MRAAFPLPLLLALAACGDDGYGTRQPEKPAATQPAEVAPEAEPPARPPPTVTAAWRGEGTTLELSVWEMRCGGCEKKVEDALGALEGVTAVTATAKDSRVVLTLARPEAREALKPLIRSTLAHHDLQIVGE